MKATDPRPSWPETGTVQFQGLTMAYRSGTEPALRDVTCTVAPGDKLGIVGRTGAGKSTLTLGLFRFVRTCTRCTCVSFNRMLTVLVTL